MDKLGNLNMGWIALTLQNYYMGWIVLTYTENYMLIFLDIIMVI